MELIIVLVIALLILGPGKLPEVGSAFGKTIREFRKASTRHPGDGQRLARDHSGSHAPAEHAVASPRLLSPPRIVADAAPRGTPVDPADDVVLSWAPAHRAERLAPPMP